MHSHPFPSFRDLFAQCTIESGVVFASAVFISLSWILLSVLSAPKLVPGVLIRKGKSTKQCGVQWESTQSSVVVYCHYLLSLDPELS